MATRLTVFRIQFHKIMWPSSQFLTSSCIFLGVCIYKYTYKTHVTWFSTRGQGPQDWPQSHWRRGGKPSLAVRQMALVCLLFYTGALLNLSESWFPHPLCHKVFDFKTKAPEALSTILGTCVNIPGWDIIILGILRRNRFLLATQSCSISLLAYSIQYSREHKTYWNGMSSYFLYSLASKFLPTFSSEKLQTYKITERISQWRFTYVSLRVTSC